MQAVAERQRSNLCGYSVTRTYTLQNKHLKPNAQMQVRLTYQMGKGKHFQILSIQASGVARKSLTDLLQAELKTDKGQQEDNAIDTSNYKFTFIGEDDCESRKCHKLGLKPRRKTTYLVDGTAWVSVADDAVVRITGRLAKSPSFWIARPEVEQRFEKVDGFWLPSYNHSSTQVFFAGEADLTIEYSSYRVQACSNLGRERER